MHARIPALCFVGLLALPVLQGWWGFAPRRPLGGVEELATTEAEWSIAGWHAGTLQQHIERRFDHSLGLRDWLVRADNEVRLRVFGVAKEPVVRGADDMLFHADYLPGKDVVRGVEAEPLLLRLHNLLRLQNALQRMGKTLIFVLSPSKSRIYQDLLPTGRAGGLRSSRPSYYAFVRDYLDRSGIHWLDCPSLFTRWREEGVEFATFPRSGAHWSRFASAKVAALLLDEIERLRGEDLRNIEVTSLSANERPSGDEDDLAVLANVLDEQRFWHATAAPRVARRDVHGRPVGMLMEGTSFVWGLTECLRQHEVASPLTFFYYRTSRTDYVAGEASPRRPAEWNDLAHMRQELAGYDVIVIESNQLMLCSLGHGTVEGLLLLYGEVPTTQLDEDLRAYLNERLPVGGR